MKQMSAGPGKRSGNGAKRNGLDREADLLLAACSKSIRSLDFFEYFLCQDKKYCGFGRQAQINTPCE